MNDWIDVNDKLPDTTRDVIVTDGIDVSVAQYNKPWNKSWIGVCNGDLAWTETGDLFMPNVIYWMECPEIPVGKD